MRAIGATFATGSDASAARRAIEALDPSPEAVAGGVLGAAGQPNDGAILLAIHVEDAQVDEVRAIVERQGGEVIDVVRLRDP